MIDMENKTKIEEEKEIVEFVKKNLGKKFVIRINRALDSTVIVKISGYNLNNKTVIAGILDMKGVGWTLITKNDVILRKNSKLGYWYCYLDGDDLVPMD